MLYLSLYLKEHRDEYYSLLQRVRLEGVWEEWLKFFVNGVAKSADEAALTARAILKQFDGDRQRIEGLGTARGRALKIHGHFQRQPLTSIAQLAEDSGLSVPTVTSALKDLTKLGVVKETTGGRYGRLFAYQPYLKLLNSGTLPSQP